jgi:hypothetical protein
VKYYHGGAPELSVGDRIVPRKDHPEWREYPVGYANETMPEFGEYKAVALTTDVEIARAYASQYVRPDAHRVPGQVYEVRPLGTVAVDPNFVHSFPEMVACQEGAEIVAVHDVVDIETNPRASVKALAKHLVNIWTGQPLYDEHGFIRLTEGLEAEGFTREDLRRLGPWAPYQYASKFTRFLEPIPPLL